MKILHTGDWHLGKTLEGYSRLEEQNQFIDELVYICDENKVDMVIISGDIYDTVNPSSSAERLFYSSMMKLSNKGERLIFIVAGNHDSPERLTASSPMGIEQGIIMLGSVKCKVEVGNYGYFSILRSEEGVMELEFKDERVVIAYVPYPSEKRLDEVISEMLQTDEEMQKSYSDKVKQIFDRVSEYYREDTINIAVGHFFVLGGDTSESERPIQLGGALAVSTSALPEKAQYVALGHLHRPQQVMNNTYYSGSPIQYSKSEINYTKSVYLVELTPNSELKHTSLFLKNYKPIEIWKVNSVEEAITMCEENSEKNVWVYLSINTEDVVSNSSIKKIKQLKKDIVEIKIDLKADEVEREEENIEEKPLEQLFAEFYLKEKKVLPRQRLVEYFLEMTQ